MPDKSPSLAATVPPAVSGVARIRRLRRHLLRQLADRRTRRHIWLVLASLLVIGALALAKGALGLYLFGNRALTVEVALVIAALVAVGFAIGQRRLESALETRFTRNTHRHRSALAALTDELAGRENGPDLETDLVTRFDALFDTHGSALYRENASGGFTRVAGHASRYPEQVPATDEVVRRLQASHAPVASAELASPVNAPMVWPLRVRGRLHGFFAAGEHNYIESFDHEEIEGVTELVNAVATTLALLEVDAERR